MRTRRLMTGLAAVLTFGLVAACSGSGGAGEASTEVDENAALRAGWTVIVSTLDPHMQTSEIVAIRSGLFQTYDRLFAVTADGEVEGMLVKRFSYSKDGLTLDMTLRDDATFRDGTSVDAEVVKKNLDRVRTLGGPMTASRVAPIDEVKVTGDYQLSLELSEPTSAIPYVLAESSGMIMNPTLFEQGDPSTEADGSGAYSVKSFTPSEKLVVVRDHPDYWDPEAAKIKQIEHIQIPDYTAFSNALSGGQIDIGQFQPNQVASLEGQPGLKKVTVPHGQGFDLFLNYDAAPLDQLEVRQALNFAVDRQAIVDALYPGSVVKHQYYREGTPGYDPELEDIYSYDPEKAKQLLADAGYPEGVDLGEVLVSTSIIPGLVDVLQQNLSEVGITFTPVTLDALAIFSRWAEGKDTAMINSATMGTNPVSGAQENWFGTTRNPAKPTPELQKLFDAASDNRLSAEEADAAAQDLNRYVVEQAYRTPIVWVNVPWMMSDRVQGFDADLNFSTTQGPYDWRYLAMSEG